MPIYKPLTFGIPQTCEERTTGVIVLGPGAGGVRTSGAVGLGTGTAGVGTTTGTGGGGLDTGALAVGFTGLSTTVKEIVYAVPPEGVTESV